MSGRDQTSIAAGTVDHEQSAHLRIKTAPDQIVKERLLHGGVLRRPFDDTKRMLLAIAVNANSS